MINRKVGIQKDRKTRKVGSSEIMFSIKPVNQLRKVNSVND
jgi:hypothetical protein